MKPRVFFKDENTYKCFKAEREGWERKGMKLLEREMELRGKT